jgi:hypothetical protein
MERKFHLHHLYFSVGLLVRESVERAVDGLSPVEPEKSARHPYPQPDRPNRGLGRSQLLAMLAIQHNRQVLWKAGLECGKSILCWIFRTVGS